MEELVCFFNKIGASKRGYKYILDKLNTEFYIVFDTGPDPETPESIDTCDILAIGTGDFIDNEHAIRLKANCDITSVKSFLVGLGIDRLPLHVRVEL